MLQTLLILNYGGGVSASLTTLKLAQSSSYGFPASKTRLTFASPPRIVHPRPRECGRRDSHAKKTQHTIFSPNPFAGNCNMADPQRIADTTKAIHAIQNDGSLTPRTKNRLTQQMLTALATPAPAPAAAAPAPAAAAPAPAAAAPPAAPGEDRWRIQLRQAREDDGDIRNELGTPQCHVYLIIIYYIHIARKRGLMDARYDSRYR